MCEQGVFHLFLWPESVCLALVKSRGLNIFRCSLQTDLTKTEILYFNYMWVILAMITTVHIVVYHHLFMELAFLLVTYLKLKGNKGFTLFLAFSNESFSEEWQMENVIEKCLSVLLG